MSKPAVQLSVAPLVAALQLSRCQTGHQIQTPLIQPPVNRSTQTNPTQSAHPTTPNPTQPNQTTNPTQVLAILVCMDGSQVPVEYGVEVPQTGAVGRGAGVGRGMVVEGD